ncbi:MAG: hypothetical protein MUC54_02050, partial [Chloroflexi bacterium]|nr:hypothetical protein [Chloroflexota bacterium]
AARREVRVTVAAEAIPGRAATLATSLPDWSLPGFDSRVAPERTFAAMGATVGSGVRSTDRVAVPIVPEPAREAVLAGVAVSGPWTHESAPLAQAGSPRTHEGPGAATARPDADPCGDLRVVLEERCGNASRLAVVAAAAAERHREARRAYDEHVARREHAAATMDPRAVRAAKDEAQANFRLARSTARDRGALENAAREWLREVNRINARSREAAALVTREDEAEQDLLRALERLGVEADGARITAESAAEACTEARAALAACEEAERLGALAAAEPPLPAYGVPLPEPTVGDMAAGVAEDDEIVRGEAAIMRLLRGDRETLRSLVDRLGGPDPDQRRHWQIQLTDLVDAILARAIAATALTFPEDHPFWGPYTQAQCRDIATALASLGFRFDGLGGFADGRVPGQRDLSLAVGYAGQDPMRIRIWPTEAEMPALFAGVQVDAGQFLAEAAGGLTLGEMVDLLGQRAEGLSDLWNAWGRVRPLLLDGG